MLKVVDELKEHGAENSKHGLELEASKSKDRINCGDHSNVKKSVVDHLVLKQVMYHAYIAMQLL